jgi:hypothetical protein
MRAGLAAAIFILTLTLLVGNSYLNRASAQVQPGAEDAIETPSARFESLSDLFQAIFDRFAVFLQQVRAELDKVRTTIGPSLRQQTQEFAESIREAQPLPPTGPGLAEVPKPEAITPPDPSGDNLGQPGCTTTNESGDNWTRLSIRCVQRQVTANGGSSSSSIVSSSSESVSESSSKQAR